MASLHRWKVITDVEVRQAPNPASALLFSAPAGKVLKQAGKIIEFPGHGARLPVLPRGWVDVASVEALDEASAADSSPKGPLTPSTVAPSSSAASGSPVNSPEAKEDTWLSDKAWESQSRANGWSENRGTGWDSWHQADNGRWRSDSHADASWRDSGWHADASTSQWDSWAGKHHCDPAWDGGEPEEAGRDGDRSNSGETKEEEEWEDALNAGEWEDELAVADNSASSSEPSPKHPVSTALPARNLRLSGDGNALGFTGGVEVGAVNRSRTPDFGTPRRGAGTYRCLDPDGLNVRTGLELSTPWVMSLPFGTLFQVSMRRKNSEGMVRLRTDCGWTSAFGAPGGTMDGQPVAERVDVDPTSAAERFGIDSNSSTATQDFSAPIIGTVPDGFDPASDPELLFVGRLREDDGEMLDCPEVSAIFGVGGLRLEEPPPPWVQLPDQPLCFAVSIEAGAPRVLAPSLKPVESGYRFAGTLRSVRRLPASEGREATGIGWVSSLAGTHLYQKDIYIFLGKSGGKGGKGSQDLSELKPGDVLSFEIHVNGKGEPQVSMGSVALLKSHVAGRSGAIDATSVEIGRTMAVSYE